MAMSLFIATIAAWAAVVLGFITTPRADAHLLSGTTNKEKRELASSKLGSITKAAKTIASNTKSAIMKRKEEKEAKSKRRLKETNGNAKTQVEKMKSRRKERRRLKAASKRDASKAEALRDGMMDKKKKMKKRRRAAAEAVVK
jgi:hypothetical protein